MGRGRGNEGGRCSLRKRSLRNGDESRGYCHRISLETTRGERELKKVEPTGRGNGLPRLRFRPNFPDVRVTLDENPRSYPDP